MATIDFGFNIDDNYNKNNVGTTTAKNFLKGYTNVSITERTSDYKKSDGHSTFQSAYYGTVTYSEENYYIYMYTYTEDENIVLTTSYNDYIVENGYFNNLNPGRAHKITITATATGYETCTPMWFGYHAWDEDLIYDENGKLIGSTINWEFINGVPQTDDIITTKIEVIKTISKIVYTHPGPSDAFSGAVSETEGKEVFISDILTTTNVSNWCTHCQKHNNWYTQSETATIPHGVSSGSKITASWYNGLVNSIKGSNLTLSTVTKDETIITAKHFTDLDEAISYKEPSNSST